MADVRKKQRVIAGAGLAAGLVAGGGAGLLIGASSGSAGAAGPAVAAAVTDPTTPSSGDTTTGSSDTPSPRPTVDREQRIREQLQPLVDDGTITAAQLDAIVAKLATAPGPGAVGGHDSRGGPGRDGGPEIRRRLLVDLDTVATTLGMTPEEVRTALRDGTTLQALAESKGKTAQDVIDALVAATKAQLDEQVSAGDLTQAEADTRLAEATTRITGLVTNGFPAGMPDGPGHRRGKPGDSSDPRRDATVHPRFDAVDHHRLTATDRARSDGALLPPRLIGPGRDRPGWSMAGRVRDTSAAPAE